MTTGKTIALTRWTLVGKVMSLLLNMLSRLVITFLPESKRLNFIAAVIQHILLIYLFFESKRRFFTAEPSGTGIPHDLYSYMKQF